MNLKKNHLFVGLLAIIILVSGISVFTELRPHLASLFPSGFSQLAQVVPTENLVYSQTFDDGDVDGKMGKARTFDGIDDVIEVAGFTGLNGATGGTVSFWMKPSAASKGILAQWGSGRVIEVTLIGTSPKATWRYAPSSGPSKNVEAIAPGTTGEWQHVAFTYDGSQAIIYKNGVAAGTFGGDGGPISTAGPSDALKIGVNSLGSYYAGVLDDLYIYSQALPADKIATLASRGAATTPPASGGETGGGNQNPPANPPSNDGTFTLTVTKSGAGSGTITGTGINCGSDCSESSLTSGTSVVLTSALGSNSTFTGWSGGGCSGNASTCTVSVTANTTVTATFASTQTQPPAQQPSAGTPTAGNITYYVSKTGSNSNPGTEASPFLTIQKCVDMARPGNTCIVTTGNYDEHPRTNPAIGGTGSDACRPVTGSYPNYSTNTGDCGAQRITIKAQGNVTTKGFDIRSAFITIDGFDITGYGIGNQGHITVNPGGSYCQVFNNTIRDGIRSVYGVFIERTSSSGPPNYCTFRGNTLQNLEAHYFMTEGDGHLFENNLVRNMNGWDAIYVFGEGHYYRRNVFMNGLTRTGQGNHPDWIQSFPDNDGTKSMNMVFEENFVDNLPESPGKETGYQIGQMNSGGGVDNPKLSPDYKNYMFRRNVLSRVSGNFNGGMPGLSFINNTFYKTAYGQQQSGLIFGGNIITSDSSGVLLKNNAFIDGGNSNVRSGFYSNGGAGLGKDPLMTLVTFEDIGASPKWKCRDNCPIANDILSRLTSNKFADGNGIPYTNSSGAMVDKDGRVFTEQEFRTKMAGSGYSIDTLWQRFKQNFDLNQSIRGSFSASYNFVTPAKDIRNYTETNQSLYTNTDPMLISPGDPDGSQDNPFSVTAGLKPRPGSPLCGAGEGGVDIGAYSCNPSTVFSNGGAGQVWTPGTPTTPTNPTNPDPQTPDPQAPSPASTLYVSKTGNDTTGDGTQAKPFLTIQKCVNVVTAGKTCFVQPGLYDESAYIKSTTGGFTVKAASGVTTRGFRLQAPNVTIDGFDMTKYVDFTGNQGHIRIEPEGDSCKILNNTIRDGIYVEANNFTFNPTTLTISSPSVNFITAGFKPGMSFYIGSNINAQIKNHDNNGGTSVLDYQYQQKIIDSAVDAVTATSIRLRPGTKLLDEGGPVPATLYANVANEKNGVWAIIMITASGRGSPDNCLISGNTFSNLAGKAVQLNGDNHIVEKNTWKDMNGWRMLAVYGNNQIIRYNVFRDSPRWAQFSLPAPGTVFSQSSGSWDMYDALIGSTGSIDQTVNNNVFEYNFIYNVDEQFVSMAENAPGAASLTKPNSGFTMRYNVFYDLEMQGGSTRPGFHLINNTFYKTAWRTTANQLRDPHIIQMGASSQGSSLNSSVYNNVFLENGRAESSVSGWYSTRAEAQGTAQQAHTPSITADYNYVGGTGFAPKDGFLKPVIAGITTSLEANSGPGPNNNPPTLNGGDPGLKRLGGISELLGPDGVPFTTDDGLKPLPSSKLCGRGQNGKDIGAYSCNPSTVFADGSGSAPQTPQTPPPSETLTISSVLASSITTGGATITWTTSEGASTQVQYGLTTNYGQTSPLVSTPLTLHTVVLTGLVANTTYNYKVISTTSGGKSANSANLTFTTSAINLPTAPSTPTAVMASAVSPSQINVTWIGTLNDQNSNVDSSYYHVYRDGTYLISVDPPRGNVLQTSVGLSDKNLSASTRYSYTVQADDGRGQKSSFSLPASATTLAAPDSTNPTVSVTAPAAGKIKGEVTLSATASDNVGIAGVQFKLNNVSIGSELVTSPYSGKWSTLGVPNGTHTLVAVARDAAGNRATSSAVSVTVENIAVNLPPSAQAGNDQTIELPSTANLEGSGTDADGPTLTYAWTKVSGPNATLGTPNNSKTIVTFSAAGTYVFKLTVSDGTSSDTDNVTITVTPEIDSTTDTDGDGIVDVLDKCPRTPTGLRPVNKLGCPLPRINNFTLKTNLENVNLNSIESFQLGNAYGKVTFDTPLKLLRSNGEAELDIDKSLFIQNQSVYLDSVKMPELSKEATITIYNVTHPSPRIVRDAAVCSVCTIISYKNGELTFKVPSFSRYVVENTPATQTPPPIISAPAPQGAFTPTVPQIVPVYSSTAVAAPASPISRYIPSTTSKTPTTPSSTVSGKKPPSPFVAVPDPTPEGISTTTASQSLTETVSNVFKYVVQRIWSGVLKVVGREEM